MTTSIFEDLSFTYSHLKSNPFTPRTQGMWFLGNNQWHILTEQMCVTNIDVSELTQAEKNFKEY